ncbi:MAG TPA: TetR/AcrR family transcriptional regulator [Solirubrobacterales bacterium]|nr:TetR/AcrR family transcriptional regulator [Solirubrobacterales bacterium]
MNDDQGSRIREALLDLVSERGYGAVTVGDVVAQAGVERADFDRLFAGKDELCVAVFDEISRSAQDGVLAAFEAGEGWRNSLRASAYAMVRYMRDHPREVGFGALHILAAGDLAQVYREQQLQQWVDLIDLGRQELDDPDSMGRGVAEGVLGSINARLLRELEKGQGTESLERFVPELMYIAVRPYLGHEVAREELEIPPPPELPSADGEAAAAGGGQGDGAPPRLPRLPRGRHGLPREFVTQNQRDRLAAGTISVVARNGFNESTIAQICAAASVSRRTFYAYFSSKEECFFAAYDSIVGHLWAETRAAAAEEVEWPAKVRAKLQAALEFFAANPDLAKFCLAIPQQAGDQVADRYRVVSDGVLDYLREGMPAGTRTPPEAVTASLVGGMVALVIRAVNNGEGEELPELLPDLLELFLVPYLGRPGAVEVAQSVAS